jgi:hypothetical protein
LSAEAAEAVERQSVVDLVMAVVVRVVLRQQQCCCLSVHTK